MRTSGRARNLYFTSLEFVDGGQQQHTDLLFLAKTDQTFAFLFYDFIIGKKNGLDVIAVHQAVEFCLVGYKIDFIDSYTHGDSRSETEKTFDLIGLSFQRKNESFKNAGEDFSCPKTNSLSLLTGSHATYHKSIARDQEDTENRQDKEGEKEIDHTPSRKLRKEKVSVSRKRTGRTNRHFQGGGHSDTPRLGKSRVTDNSFIGLTNKKTDDATKRRS